jgi:hypothetical protein
MSARPEFLEASPTVFGFDFNALAGVSGGGVPDSDSPNVVRHDDVVRTGNSAVPSSMGSLEVIQQPAQPPQGHASTIPGYPWEGHPQIAYSQPLLGPGGTSPMRRGGPNLPAYAVAPETPHAYTGAGYPYATPGTYTPVPGQTPFVGYAGPDLGRSAEERQAARMSRQMDRQERRDRAAVARQAQKNQIDVTDGPYVYRLYAAGPIRILRSPRGGVGKIINPGEPGYAAIIASVGTFRDNKQRQTFSALSATAEGIAKITEAATGGRRRGRGRGRQQAPPAYVPPTEPKRLPGWVVPAATGGLALVFLVALFKK